jgi:hypothetical protein
MTEPQQIEQTPAIEPPRDNASRPRRVIGSRARRGRPRGSRSRATRRGVPRKRPRNSRLRFGNPAVRKYRSSKNISTRHYGLTAAIAQLLLPSPRRYRMRGGSLLIYKRLDGRTKSVVFGMYFSLPTSRRRK